MRRRIALTALLAAFAAAPAAAEAGSRDPWPMGGRDIFSTRSNPAERTIGPANAGSLAVKWTFRTTGSVSATPAVVGGAVYFPDWGGYLHKLDARTGRAIWSRRLPATSRTSPAVTGGTVYIGDLDGAHLMALSARTGRVRWVRQLDSHPQAILTASPVVFDGVIYQGVSSGESRAAGDPSYPCCTFRGSMTAVDAATGRLLWKTHTVPEGYTGGAIWGMPAVDPRRRRVYATTGQNYKLPKAAKDCQLAGGTPAQCLPPDNHFDSILALDMDTGRIEWAHRTLDFDDRTDACIPGYPPANCPENPGPNADLAAGAQLFRSGRRRVVGAGQKSGVYWALDARTGEVLWRTQVAPGGPLGGIQWGTATDGRRIYVAATNLLKLPHTLPDGSTITTGSFGALDAATGRILWQIADPSGAMGMGAVSAANGVVYAPSTSGHMYALDAATGRVLWTYKGEGSAMAGAAIAGGTVYWGNGYTQLGLVESRTFYAFSPRGS